MKHHERFLSAISRGIKKGIVRALAAERIDHDDIEFMKDPMTEKIMEAVIEELKKTWGEEGQGCSETEPNSGRKR